MTSIWDMQTFGNLPSASSKLIKCLWIISLTLKLTCTDLTMSSFQPIRYSYYEHQITLRSMCKTFFLKLKVKHIEPKHLIQHKNDMQKSISAIIRQFLLSGSVSMQTKQLDVKQPQHVESPVLSNIQKYYNVPWALIIIFSLPIH